MKSAAPLKEAAESPYSLMLGNPALSRLAASGGCQASILFNGGKEKPLASTEGIALGIDQDLTHFLIFR